MTCAFVITIVLNTDFNTKFSKLCGDLNKSISITSKPIVSAARVKDCKVVLEDISSSCDAEKLKMVHTNQENSRTTNSDLTKEDRLIEDSSVKTPIAWGEANDECVT